MPPSRAPVTRAAVRPGALPESLQSSDRSLTSIAEAWRGRALYNGNPVGNDAWWSLAWSVGLIAVFSALATRKFSRSTSG